MASACVNNVGMPSENFADCPMSCPAADWLNPRIGFRGDLDDDGGRNGDRKPNLEGSVKDFVDFEFRLDDPVEMLSADELFSDGKLIPLQLPSIRPVEEDCLADVRSPVPINLWRGVEMSGPDLYSFSPKAPRCSSRWKEFLGLKKALSSKPDRQTSAPATSKICSAKSLKLFLRRNPSSSSGDSSPSIPLLRDSDAESVFISSRVSLSSSSSGADQEDLPRFSVDSENVNPAPNARSPAICRPSALRGEGMGVSVGRSTTRRAPESVAAGNVSLRIGRSPVRCPKYSDDLPPPRGSSVDSPRLNASGKVIFKGLERSSSTSNAGPRLRSRGMERSYSANVQVAPVLNVPVCILRGSAKSISPFYFGQLFSPQKKEKEGSSAAKHAISNIANFTKTTCEKPASRN